MEGEVMEGFICPLCYKDLKTAFNLNAHFQEHSQDELNIVKSFKGFYDKAIKKIKGSEGAQSQESEPVVSNNATVRRIPGYSASPADDPTSASCRSHLAKFKAIRDMRNERYAAQTNTLLIRIGKLLLQLPSDPVKRKAYEQEVVAWVDEKDVHLCPGCAKPFNLLKRKHHCRLCGSVMCNNCTFLLSLDDARKMVGASNSVQVPPASPLNKIQQQAVQAVLSLEGHTVSDLRICEHCQRLLSAREAMRHNRTDRPILAQFYERMRTALESCDAAVTSYHNIYTSLCNGESMHTLDEAKALRIEVIRLADTVDGTSKKIAALGSNSDMPPSAASQKIQLSVRNAAAQYLKKKVISLPSLPTEQELFEFQERRRLEIERRIEEERRKEMEEESRRAQEAKEQLKVMNLSASSSSHSLSSLKQKSIPNLSSKVTLEEGWTPSVNQAIITDDPLLQQIGILHGFIEQARSAGKLDECQALERNLMELEQALDQREAPVNA